MAAMRRAQTLHDEGGQKGDELDRRVPHSDTGRAAAWYWGAIILVGLAAFTIRYVHVVATQDIPFARQLAGDARGYYEWGARIAAGDAIGKEAFYQAPLYPYAVGAIFKVFGQSVACVRMTQAVLGSIGVVLLAMAARRLFDRREGVVAGAMAALYAPAIFFDGVVQKASLGSFLLCALMWMMTRRGNGWPWIAGGIGALGGLLTLTRENALIWLPVLALYVFIAERRCDGAGAASDASTSDGNTTRSGSPRRAWLSVVIFAMGLLVVLGPVGVRNMYVSGQLSFSTFQAGPNFYIGNHAGASGRYEPLVRGHETPEFERADATRLAEEATGRQLTPREVSRYWMSRAWQDVGADVPGWLRLCGTKMLMVWNRYEVSDVESQYIYARYSPVLNVFGGVWHFGALVPLAVIGVAGAAGRWRRLWVWYALIVSMAGAVAIFYVMARYRFPLVPLLIPFAAVGCTTVWDGIVNRDARRLALPLGLAVIAAIASNLRVHDEDRLDALAVMNLGVAVAREGDLPVATEHFLESVRLHPTSAEARNNLAQALALQGRFAEAIEHYEAALALTPGLIGVDYNLAVALEQVGRTGAAMTHYRRAVELNAGDVGARPPIERLERGAP